MEIIDGRNFDAGSPSANKSYIINETAAQVLGLASPVGTVLATNREEGKIIGVVRDFNNGNLREEIKPLIITYEPNNPIAFARINANDRTSTIQKLEDLFHILDAKSPFEFHFLDDRFDREYKSEMTMGKLSILFTIVAIAISCLGLYGLVSFATERRTKEICLRKIMGATSTSLVALLCKDFMKLVLIAVLLGTPVAIYISQVFLDSYAFHTVLSPLVVIVSIAGVLIISLLTAISKSMSASMMNPAESLRNE
jgi:ABC-type antimicrobial peptide transport system permease subunit